MTKRILVVGAGFAGMWSALGAARLLIQEGVLDVEVALIAPEPELQVRPRFYEEQVAGMRTPLLEIFGTVGVRFIQGWVTQIDTAAHEVRA